VERHNVLPGIYAWVHDCDIHDKTVPMVKGTVKKAVPGKRMISYSVKHHIRGRIRIEVPLLKKMTPAELKKLAGTISTGPRAKGIKDISANPLTGSITITYDPVTVDIKSFIRDLASVEEARHLALQKD